RTAAPGTSLLSLHDALPISRHAKYVDGHDGFGVGGDLALHVVGIQLVRVRLHISQHRKRVATQYGSHRSKIGIGRSNDFIAGSEDRKSTRLNSSHVKISYAV